MLKPDFIQAGVMGWPVGHSLSPRVHGFWLKELGLNGDYVRLPVEPEYFVEKLKALKDDGFAGCNVTVPHKEAALKNVDEVHPLAERIGAVNTIKVQEDGSLYGFNTDGFGFLENLRHEIQGGTVGFDPKSGPAVILGAGGAARAVVVSLLDAGTPEIRLLNRTRTRAEDLAQEFLDFGAGNIIVEDWDHRSDCLQNAALLINTTTLGMQGQRPLEIDLKALPQAAVVNDIVYAPLETDLLARAKAQGNQVVDGLGMLLHQARPGFEAWFGQMPEVSAALRTYVLAEKP
ncbi:MAG: shikimate dehydrogenase [Rhodospirillaceae bacterium]|nr:MAG: shikimate dehydrogenase [Rhodospirillaceae bacterium]